MVRFQHDRQSRDAELDRVARLQLVRLGQSVIVQQRPILTPDVSQPVPAIAEVDAGMMA